MALIKCPECGNEISERAEKCPKCGKVFKEEKKICEECGTELNENDIVCSNCGCPVPDKKYEPQKVEVTNVNLNKKTIKIIGVIVGCIIAAIILGLVVNNNMKQAKEEKLKEEAIKVSEDYQANLTLAVYQMLDGASEAESAGNLIHDVWYNTIYDESDPETDRYTRGHSDFNDSLQALFDDSAFSIKIDSITSNQETVKELMKSLKNPPEEYIDAYDSIKNFYDAYLELTNLVTDPTGSLQTYTDNFNDADTNVVKYYEAMAMYIEE